jgi:molybdenum-dependent DNA-binding transcriptional regulator ModE
MPRNGDRYQPGNRKIDHFAEALAETGEITAAAQQMGITREYGKCLFRRIRKDLGWQAS